MSDMTGATDSLAGDNKDLQTIEAGGTELTPAFVDAFNKMSPEQRNIWVEDARRKVMASEFGWAASFLDDAELGPLLRRAAGPPPWSPDKLSREIKKTNWWQSRTVAQRQWDQGVASDPATFNQRVETQKRGIKEVAAGLSLVLNDEQITALATESLRSGWDEDQTINAIANEGVRGESFGADIRFGITGRGVRGLASQYAVPLSDQAADGWAEKLATGGITQTDYENYLRGQAKSLYPSLADDIDRGVNVSTIIDPYSQVAVSTLGINAAEIDFADPKWNAALNFDDGKGRRMMTLFEWGEHLRRDERYDYDRTPEATSKAYRMVSDLGRMFGLSA